MDAQQRRAPVLEAEEALEARSRGRGCRGRRAARRPKASMPDSSPRRSAIQVSASVPMTTSGGAARRAPARAGAVLGAAHLPGVADVAEHDLPRRVEARLGAEIALRQRAKARLDGRQARCMRGRRRHRHGKVPRSGAAWHTSRGTPTPRSGELPAPRRSLGSTRWPRSACTTPARASCASSSRAPTATSASTPAGRRSTGASTSATRGRSSSSRCSSASSSTRATTSRSSSTSPTSTTRSTTPPARPDVPSADLAAEMAAHYVADTDGSGWAGPTPSRWPPRRSSRSSR